MGDDPTEKVKLSIQGEDVTDSASWTVTESLPPTGGVLCYVPPEPLSAGSLVANVRFSDVSGREYTYSWAFTVTE